MPIRRKVYCGVEMPGKTLNRTDIERITSMIESYYTRYYRDSLGISDWQQRVMKRLDEETAFAQKNLQKLEKWVGSFGGKKVLVVGAGTGAELFSFARRGAEADGIEPDVDAVNILRLKAKLYAIPEDRIIKGVAEDIKYPDGTFDFVYCYTVLEHVQDVIKSLKEIIRVTRAGGFSYINTPNYLYPYEGHYKVTCFPPALPAGRFLLKLLLQMKRRPTDFIKTLNFLSDRQVKRILSGYISEDVIDVSYIHPFNSNSGLTGLYCKLFGVFGNQNILIKKL